VIVDKIAPCVRGVHDEVISNLRSQDCADSGVGGTGGCRGQIWSPPTFELVRIESSAGREVSKTQSTIHTPLPGICQLKVVQINPLPAGKLISACS